MHAEDQQRSLVLPRLQRALVTKDAPVLLARECGSIGTPTSPQQQREADAHDSQVDAVRTHPASCESAELV